MLRLSTTLKYKITKFFEPAEHRMYSTPTFFTANILIRHTVEGKSSGLTTEISDVSFTCCKPTLNAAVINVTGSHPLLLKDDII